MKKEEVALQNALTTTFLANLAFLSIYDKDLYHRVDELSQMIGDGRYQEKYMLDFIEENGEFDIYDKVNEKYLYNKKPKKINNDLINSKSEISCFNSFLFEREGDINSEEMINSLQEGGPAIRLFKKDFQEYVDILKVDPSKCKKEFNKINKFLIVGVLSGRHIPKLAKKVDASIYLICEANLEIFRLSLFTVDYTILAKNKGVIFSIMDDQKSFTSKVNNFLHQDLFSNHKIKYSTTNINVNTYFESIFSAIVRRDSMIFNHYMMQDCIMRNMANRISDYKILNFKEIEKSLSFLKGYPVLYVCAGPSLSDNIDWIKDNKNKFIIVSIGASFEKLFDNGIESDIIITLDSQRLLAEKQFKKESLYKMKDAIVLASTMTDEFTLKQFDDSKLFLYEVIHPFLNNKVFNAFSVGEMGLSILLNLNFDNIHMIGTDLALNQTTGATHINEHFDGDNILDIDNFNTASSMNKNTFGFRGDLIKVTGNLQDKVITSRLFESSILCYENNIKLDKKEFQTIYNHSNHGAFIEGSEPLSLDVLTLDDYSEINNRKEIKDKLIVRLNNFSYSNFSKKELKKILAEIDYINDVLVEIDELSGNKHNNYEELYEDFWIIIEKLLRSNGVISFGTEIFMKYFTSTLPYINYCFNDKKKVKSLQLKLTKIQSIFYMQVTELISRYNKYLVEMTSKN